MMRWPCDRVRWRVSGCGVNHDYRFHWIAWLVAHWLALFAAGPVSLLKVCGWDGIERRATPA